MQYQGRTFGVIALANVVGARRREALAEPRSEDYGAHRCCRDLEYASPIHSRPETFPAFPTFPEAWILAMGNEGNAGKDFRGKRREFI
jgi:hypothetical protein